MKKFIESEHPRDKEGKFTDKELKGMSAKQLSDKLKIDLDDDIDFSELNNHYNWAIENGVVSPLVSFELYKHISNQLKEIAIGKVAADGTLIREIKNHCIDRVCGTTERENDVKHEGVPLEDFKETLFNGNVRKGVGKNQNKIFITGKCVIVVNFKTGAIIQCNKKK